MTDDSCVCCGEYVPEGRQVCWGCENGTTHKHESKVKTDWYNYFKAKGFSSEEIKLKISELFEAADKTFYIAQKYGVEQTYDEWCKTLLCVSNVYQYL